MKKLIVLLFTLFLTLPLYADSVRDFEGNNKIKLDEHYICENEDEKIIFEMGFHKVNGKIFYFNYNVKIGYTVLTSVRDFKTKIEDRNVESYVFPYPSDTGLVAIIFIKNYNFKNEKTLFMNWINDDSSINWRNDHYNLFEDNSENIDQKYIDFSEKALDNIFRVLEFGTPFMPDDIWSIPDEKLRGGNFHVCK